MRFFHSLIFLILALTASPGVQQVYASPSGLLDDAALESRYAQAPK